MEPRWNENCQRQCRRNHQDLGCAVWRLPIDPGRALKHVRFFSSSFSQSVSLSVSVDLCPDFSQFQGQISGVEPRWKANCQRQFRQHHQDLGLAIWRLPVDADRALEYVRFFLKFFLFVLVDSCANFSQIQCLFSGVEPRWKANCQR